MNKNRIVIEQSLHGYSQGHHLLGASISLSKNSQRIMTTLSDFSGPELYEGFSEYLTGYPLAEDKYYALAKTWYASEMDRPGCAWTHSFLIRFEDLAKIEDETMLIGLFDKPSKDSDKNNYTSSFELPLISNNLHIPSSNEFYSNELQYLIWAIYSTNKPVILPSFASNQYEKLILWIWKNQWSTLQNNFSFCTGSLANRKLGKQTLDIQVVPYALSKSVGRSDSNSILLSDDKINHIILEQPKYLSQVMDEITNVSNHKLKKFLDDFGSIFSTRDYYIKLVRLYIDTNAKEGIKSIDDYLLATKNIFNNEEFNLIMGSLLEKSIVNPSNEWFPYKNITSLLQALTTAENLNDTSNQDMQLTFHLESLWNEDRNSMKNLFKWLISRDLNYYGEVLLKEYSHLIKSDQLAELTDMDLGSCNVLVSLNPNFALCSTLWNQSINFQQEILNCLRNKPIDNELKIRIIKTILKHGSDALYKMIVEIFGIISIKIFLDWCKESFEKDEQKIKAWIKICALNPEETLNSIESLNDINVKFLISIISVFDPYSYEVRQLGIKPWIKIINSLNYKNLDHSSQLILAEFFLPLVLINNETIPNDIVNFSFLIIYKELEKDQLAYDQLIKLESLLPSLSWYNNWDKCKRLRIAMERIGYRYNFNTIHNQKV